MTLRDELNAIVKSSADRINDHPFHRGIRDGTLPAPALTHYLLQDSHYVLPNYARALATCAATIPDHHHAQLLTQIAAASLTSAADSAHGFPALAERLQLPIPQTDPPPITPTTLMITSFFTASATRSPAAGIGALLPSAWLWLLVTDDLLARHDPSSRYAEIVKSWHPGDTYPPIVADLLTLVDEITDKTSTHDHTELIRNVEHAARCEWMTVDAAWRLESWPY